MPGAASKVSSECKKLFTLLHKSVDPRESSEVCCHVAHVLCRTGRISLIRGGKHGACPVGCGVVSSSGAQHLLRQSSCDSLARSTIW